LRNLLLPAIDRWRDTRPQIMERYGSFGGGGEGVFCVPSKRDAKTLYIVVSSDLGWDHVSVSRRDRVPNWYEMEQVKRLFFEDHEIVLQYHVPDAVKVNIMANCLHLWRPQAVRFPVPPAIFV
jgi:hypothetical protein